MLNVDRTGSRLIVPPGEVERQVLCLSVYDIGCSYKFYDKKNPGVFTGIFYYKQPNSLTAYQPNSPTAYQPTACCLLQ